MKPHEEDSNGAWSVVDRPGRCRPSDGSPRPYVNWNATSLVAAAVNAPCGGTLATGDQGFGGVVFCAGDLAPNGLGQVSLTINDLLFNPAVGQYCQDLNADDWCGGNPSILPPDPYGQDQITGTVGEPAYSFCGSTTLQSPLSLSYKMVTEWADPVNFGGNWDPAVEVVVFLRGYSDGNAAEAPCGLDATSAPTSGEVTH